MTHSDGAPVLAARRLSVGYGSRMVLRGVDTYIRPGGSVALVGSNGSGKSTLLKTLAGILPALEGGIEILGQPIHETTREVAYLGQSRSDSFVLPLRVVDVVRMARYDKRPRWSRRSAFDEACVAEAMEKMGIADLARASMQDLSGGQRQRVLIAQMLARRARLLLLDEPTTGLDAPGRSALQAAIEDEHRRGAAVLNATHDVAEAARCDRVMLLAGRVVADGPPSEVLTPENLLETFGIGLARVGDRLVVTEHSHDHG